MTNDGRRIVVSKVAVLLMNQSWVVTFGTLDLVLSMPGSESGSEVGFLFFVFGLQNCGSRFLCIDTLYPKVKIRICPHPLCFFYIRRRLLNKELQMRNIGVVRLFPRFSDIEVEYVES